ncbi:MAG: hypothetical protein BMS9Abin05_1500 [Rhodothermia bacterium]|nr:MAG: hypothetical protein BMS9Abin05_1500 [Rhodothermia bacterium]
MTLSFVRAFLLLIFLMGVTGSAAELLLLGHTEEFWKYLPLVLYGISLLMLGWHTVSRASTGLKLFRYVMSLFILAGPVGLFLHYRGNVAFKLEMYPDLGGLKLFWEALTGATPALAPGTMILLGLLGWLYTFRHPRFSKTPNIDPDRR